MTTFLEVKNNAYSKVATTINASATTLAVTAGEGDNFPSSFPFHLTMQDEIVSATASPATDNFTIVRAQQDTTAAVHRAGTGVFLNWTAKSISDLNTAVNTVEGITLGITATPAEINLLDLASLTAGELLVATSEAAAAWQSTGVKLSAPDISGTVTAASTLTLPAHTINGNITCSSTETIDGIDISAHDVATTGVHGITGTILGTEDVDDTPENGATTAPVSSNWAYDHAASATGHPYYHVTSEQAQAFKAEYNITTNDLATYVHGVKVELTRAADIQPSNGCWFGGQFVLNAGSSGYTDLDKPAYVLQAIMKGSDATPNGVDIHVGRFETQSAASVSDIVHILANTGTTIAGHMLYLASHINTDAILINVQSSATMGRGIEFMTGAGASITTGIDMSGASMTTDIIFQEGTTLVDDGTSLTLAGANFVSTLGATTLASDITGGGYDLNNIGHIGLGNRAADADYGVYYWETVVITDNNFKAGAYIDREAYKTSATFTNYDAGGLFVATVDALNTQNWTNGKAGLRGVYSLVATETGTASSSTITGAASFFADLVVGSATNDMVLTNYYGLYVDANTLVGNSKLTNDYGIYVGNQAGGATLNYAIYTAGGAVYHAGNLQIAGTSQFDDLVTGIVASEIEVSELSTATYDDVQDYINLFGDRTLLSGGATSANADVITVVTTGGAGSASFGISGDQTAIYKEDDTITVSGSTLNDDDYTIKADSTYAGDTTTITVDEAVSDGTVDGSIYGSITVASLTAWCKITDSETAVGKFLDYDGGDSTVLTDDATNFVYLDYNDGTPQLAVATSISTYERTLDHILLSAVFRDGAVFHIHNRDKIGIGSASRSNLHWLEHFLVHRVSGMVTTSVGTRQLDVTAGVVYAGLTRNATNAFNTSTGDTFSYWWTANSGTSWTEVTGQTTISNTQYNDITSGLEDLTATPRYGVHWVYVDNDGTHLHVVYGQDNYLANTAEEAGVPATLPNLVTNYCVLIAKIIVQKDQPTLIISYPWTSVFATSLATDHNSLANLTTGDVHTQYFLLAGETTAAQLHSGADLIVYSDAGSTEVARIDGATGAITTSSTVDGVDIAGHLTTTSGIHGVGAGAIVGTTLSQELTNKTLGAVTLNGAVTGGGNEITGISRLTSTASTSISLDFGAANMRFYTRAAGPGAATLRLTISDNANTAVATWANVTHTGMVLSGNLTCAGAETIDGIDVSAHDVATTGVHGAGANTILYSDHTTDVDAHGEVVITTEDSNTATSADLALTMAAGEGINTTSTGSTVTITGEAASTTNVGVVELAIGSEVNTGTSTTLAVTPDALDDWTGSAQITTVGTLSAGNADAAVTDATTSAKGKAELAIASEINAGDDTTRTISSKELSDSNYGKRIMYVKVLANDTAVTTGDSKAIVTIPIELNGMNLVLAHAAVYTTSSGAAPSISLVNLDGGNGGPDMLSTDITIDASELTSYTANTPPVIDGNEDDVATGQRISINVDTAGTDTAGLDVILTFQLP